MPRYIASIDSLQEMMSHMKSHQEVNDLEATPRERIHLAVEEIVVNIIKYAYPEQSGWIDIEISSRNTFLGKEILIMIQDHGIPFNPVTHPLTLDYDNPQWTLEREGGFGIFLVRKVMHKIDYHRHQDHNILTLIYLIK